VHLLSMELINLKKIWFFFNFDQSQANSTYGGYVLSDHHERRNLCGEPFFPGKYGSTLSSNLEEY
jgi:hypothetical protein